MPSDDKCQFEKQIWSHLYSFIEISLFSCFFAYMSTKEEVDTSLLINTILTLKKKVALPKVNGQKLDFFQIPFDIPFSSSLTSGAYGIQEPNHLLCKPIDYNEAEIIFIPGAVFDIQGNRIGYGKGFYDRFLSQYNFIDKRPMKIAFAFEYQVLPIVPHEADDQKIDIIVTERRVIRCSDHF